MTVNMYQGSTLAVFRYPEHPRFPDGIPSSNPAGLQVFATIWGPDFRASITISRASSLKNPGERNDVLEFSMSVQNAYDASLLIAI